MPGIKSKHHFWQSDLFACIDSPLVSRQKHHAHVSAAQVGARLGAAVGVSRMHMRGGGLLLLQSLLRAKRRSSAHEASCFFSHVCVDGESI